VTVGRGDGPGVIIHVTNRLEESIQIVFVVAVGPAAESPVNSIMPLELIPVAAAMFPVSSIRNVLLSPTSNVF
jgi:hypothetical protein